MWLQCVDAKSPTGPDLDIDGAFPPARAFKPDHSHEEWASFNADHPAVFEHDAPFVDRQDLRRVDERLIPDDVWVLENNQRVTSPRSVDPPRQDSAD
jgi:hypothetical protein